MRSSPLLGLLLLAGCLQVTTGSDVGAGGGRTTQTSVATPSDAGPMGAGCSRDPASQVVLCEQLDSCPGVSVDQGAFPGCGFRLNAPSPLDLECLCTGALCLIGVPTNCAEAAQLLAMQTVLAVCQQLDEGRCVEIARPDAGASATSTCDRLCESECAGDPNCIQQCGC